MIYYSQFTILYLQGPANLSVGGAIVRTWSRAADSHARTTDAAMINTPAVLMLDIFNTLIYSPTLKLAMISVILPLTVNKMNKLSD